MNTILDPLWCLWNALRCVGELLGYLLRFVSGFFRTRASLAARLLAAESQLAVCKRRIEQKGSSRPGFTAGFRLLWVVLSKLWAPWQSPYVERLIGSIRRECLDHVIVLNEEHLRRVLSDCLTYYHQARAHLSLDRNSPIPRPAYPPDAGKVVATAYLGGLHHRYTRAP